jgi:hypothetical protein
VRTLRSFDTYRSHNYDFQCQTAGHVPLKRCKSVHLLFPSRFNSQKWPLAILIAILLAPGSAWLHLLLTAGLPQCGANCPISHCLIEHHPATAHSHGDTDFHGDSDHDHHPESSELDCETVQAPPALTKAEDGESSRSGEAALCSGFVSTGQCTICSHFSLALAKPAPSDFEISNPVCRLELASRGVFTQLVHSGYSARGPPLS